MDLAKAKILLPQLAVLDDSQIALLQVAIDTGNFTGQFLPLAACAPEVKSIIGFFAVLKTLKLVA